MSVSITLAELGAILGVKPVNESAEILAKTVTGVVTDSRDVKTGDLFIALRGENFDGHHFIAKAKELGAIAAIVENGVNLELDITTNSNLTIFAVDDTLKAYQNIASWWRERFAIPVIALTGSVGKTTTKELIAAVLGTQGKVLKTQANYNNEIGVPKTLLNISAQDNFAVIEMGMRGLGQIALLTKIAKPTIGVITNVGTAHIGILGSVESIAQAKCELLAEMPPDSIAILNYDNVPLVENAPKYWSGKTVTYGLTGGDVHGTIIDHKTMRIDGVDLPLPLIGEHNALNYLAALAVGKVLGISWEKLKQELSLEMPEGRAKRYELPRNITLLDETYNAGLESMLASLKLLSQTVGKRRIGVLGTMKELGDKSLEFHKKVGIKARELKLDALFIFAEFAEASAMAEGAAGLPLIEIVDVTNNDAHTTMAERVKDFMKEGDTILFKASHSMQLNKVVEKLL